MREEFQVRPGGTKLTPAEFIRAFEFYRKKYDLEMEEAYERVVEYCISNMHSLTFSTFPSFQRAFYIQIRREKICHKKQTDIL